MLLLSHMLRVALFAALIFGLFAVPTITANAQENPFSRRVVQPEPEPEPDFNTPPPAPVAAAVPPSVLQAQQAQEAVDFASELRDLEVVAARNGRAAVRGLDRLYFLQTGALFDYNGNEYLVAVQDNLLLLAVDRGEEEEPLVVFDQRVGQSVPNSATFSGGTEGL